MDVSPDHGSWGHFRRSWTNHHPRSSFSRDDFESVVLGPTLGHKAGQWEERKLREVKESLTSFPFPSHFAHFPPIDFGGSVPGSANLL